MASVGTGSRNNTGPDKIAHRNSSRRLIEELEAKARLFRTHVLHMIYEAVSGHLGCGLSAADILLALYFHHLRVDPANPRWEGRDRFVLSKGNGRAALYATLAEEARIAHPVAQGRVIRYTDVSLDESSLLVRLQRKQVHRFLSERQEG